MSIVLYFLAFVGIVVSCVGLYTLFKFYILNRIDALEKRNSGMVVPGPGYSSSLYRPSLESIGRRLSQLETKVSDISHNICEDEDDDNELPIIGRVLQLEDILESLSEKLIKTESHIDKLEKVNEQLYSDKEQNEISD